MDQMIDRTGAIGHVDHPPRIARLAHHRLVFQRLENGLAAFANILSPGEDVLGVIYRCSQTDLERLDRFESGYERQPIMVTDQHDNVVGAVAYVLRPVQTASIGKPSAVYLAKIVTGARQHGLPESYISNIVAIAQSS